MSTNRSDLARKSLATLSWMADLYISRLFDAPVDRHRTQNEFALDENDPKVIERIFDDPGALQSAVAPLVISLCANLTEDRRRAILAILKELATIRENADFAAASFDLQRNKLLKVLTLLLE